MRRSLADPPHELPGAVLSVVTVRDDDGVGVQEVGITLEQRLQRERMGQLCK
jgi:hypothetical protein